MYKVVAPIQFSKHFYPNKLVAFENTCKVIFNFILKSLEVFN